MGDLGAGGASNGCGVRAGFGHPSALRWPVALPRRAGRAAAKGFSIAAALASARDLAARIEAQAPDLSVELRTPRDVLQECFARRSDPRAFDIPVQLGGVL